MNWMHPRRPRTSLRGLKPAPARAPRTLAAAALAAVTAITVFAVPAAAAPTASVLCAPREGSVPVGLQRISVQQLSARSVLYTFRSQAVGPDATPDGLVRVRVTVPTGYATSSNKTKRYPVVYDLHGTGGDATVLPTQQIESIVGDQKVIFVSPDGGTIGAYTDWFGANLLGINRVGASPTTPPGWETFHIRELLPWIDQNLRTTGHRAIEGGSMGGMGAMSYAARHPELFDAAGSFSGALDTQLASVGSEAAASVVWDPCAFGDPLLQEDNWTAHNPTAQVDQLRDMALFVASGNGLPGRYDSQLPDPTAVALEVLVNAMSHSFVDAAGRAGIPVRTYFYGNGTHPFPGEPLNYAYDDMRLFLPQAIAAMTS